MRTRALAGGLLALLVPTTIVSCSDTFDTSRTLPSRGTLGAELFGVMCDRVGAQSLHEDLTGASYYSICHAPFTDTVDVSQLPPLVDGQLNTAGQPVPIAQQESDRAYGVARIQTLAQHRSDLIAALDATFPDVMIAVKDVTNPDPTKSCNAPAASGEGRLHDALTDLLGRFQGLYDDGTIPQSTESIAAVVNAFKADPDAQKAWAVFDARAGYRPIDINLGAARPTIAYPQLRDFSNATLALFSADSQPYAQNPQLDANGNRIPVPGPAYPQLSQLLGAAHAELLNATADPAVPPLVVTTDPITGRAVLSRPRQDMELLQSILYAQNAAFGGGASQYIVQRDPRGYVTVPLVNGKVPPPFQDGDGDGLPDVDGNGNFLTSGGSAPSPFYALNAPDAAARDTAGRALTGAGGTARLRVRRHQPHVHRLARAQPRAAVRPQPGRRPRDADELPGRRRGALRLAPARRDQVVRRRRDRDLQRVRHAGLAPARSGLRLRPGPGRSHDRRHLHVREDTGLAAAEHRRAPRRRQPLRQEPGEQGHLGAAAQDVDALGRDDRHDHPDREGARAARGRPARAGRRRLAAAVHRVLDVHGQRRPHLVRPDAPQRARVQRDHDGRVPAQDAGRPHPARQRVEPQRDAALPAGHPRHQRRDGVQQGGRRRARAQRQRPCPGVAEHRHPDRPRQQRTRGHADEQQLPQRLHQLRRMRGLQDRQPRGVLPGLDARPGQPLLSRQRHPERSQRPRADRRHRQRRPHRELELPRLRPQQRRHVQRLRSHQAGLLGPQHQHHLPPQARVARSSGVLRPGQRQPETGRHELQHRPLPDRSARHADRRRRLPRARHPRSLRDEQHLQGRAGHRRRRHGARAARLPEQPVALRPR